MRKSLLLGSTFALATAYAGAAPAQEEARTYWRQHVAAPAQSFELGVASGYAQGFGRTAPSRAVQDTAGPGIGFALALGYRIDPKWSIGAYGGFQDLSSGTLDAHARAMNAGFHAEYHVAPYTRVDPWVRVGAGYRAFWEVHASANENVARQGFELAKIDVGADLRVGEKVALGPMVGADLNAMIWQMPYGGTNASMATAQFSAFVFAGVQGTFDFGGATEAAPVPSLAARGAPSATAW
jgi:hypothetical protein